ncbi:MAG: FHA domain-containing protein [Acidimicrobiales bacterium]
MNARRRVEVLGGMGTVHREAGLVCWFAPGFSPELAAAVLDAARSAGAGDVGQLALRLEAAQPGSPAAFCVIREEPSSLTIALQGRVVVSEDGAERLRGSEGGGIVRADVAIETSLTVRGGADPHQVDRPGCIAFDLRDGTVPGGGVTFWASPPKVVTEAAVLDEHVVLFDLSRRPTPSGPLPIASAPIALDLEESEKVSAPSDPSERPPPPGDLEPTKLVIRESAAASAEEVGSAGTGPGTPSAGIAPTPAPLRALIVRGVNCARGHFNNPRALYCGICGLAMVQNSVVIVEGPRPPLGVLLGDDGNAYSLDGDYVLGRQPELAEDVASGRARPLKVPDEMGRVSRVHARVALRDWEVVVTDLGSHNGTQLCNPGDKGWRRLRGNESQTLHPGGRLVVGQSTFEFQSIQRQ